MYNLFNLYKRPSPADRIGQQCRWSSRGWTPPLSTWVSAWRSPERGRRDRTGWGRRRWRRSITSPGCLRRWLRTATLTSTQRRQTEVGRKLRQEGHFCRFSSFVILSQVCKVFLKVFCFWQPHLLTRPPHCPVRLSSQSCRCPFQDRRSKRSRCVWAGGSGQSRPGQVDVCETGRRHGRAYKLDNLQVQHYWTWRLSSL